MARRSDERTRRQLHQRIARLRRRIDRSAERLWFESTRMLSWKTYVRHWPIASLAASLGLGLLASLSLRSMQRQVTKRIFPTALSGSLGSAWHWLSGLRPRKRRGASAAPPPDGHAAREPQTARGA
jgi:hypothetical protein